MNACSYFQIPTGTTTAQFTASYPTGKTITERLDAIINALITSTTSTSLNDGTTNLNVISGAFPASNSIDQRLDAILNALVRNAATTDSSAVSTITTQFGNEGQDIDAKLDAILNALVRNAGESSTSNPATTISGQFGNQQGQDLDSKMDAVLNALVKDASTTADAAGQISGQFGNGEGQDIDAKLDAILNALVQNAATSSSPNPAGAITAKFDNMADNTLAVAVDIENTRRVDLRLDSTRYAVNCLQTVVSNIGILDNCTCTFQIVFTLFFQVDQLATATPSVNPTGTTCTAPAQIITLDNIGALP